MVQGAEAAEIASLRQAVQGGDSSAAMELAMLLKRQGDEQGMLAAFEDADRLGNVDGSGSLGREYARMNRLEDAELAYDRCVERGGGERAIAERTLVRIRRDRVEPDEVTPFVAQWCATADLIDGHRSNLTPDLLPAFAFCVDVEEHAFERLLNNHREAFLAGVLKADQSGSPHAAYLAGIVLDLGGNLREAADALRTAAERGKTAAWLSVARVLARLGDSEGALDAARAAQDAGIEGAAELAAELQNPTDPG